MEPTKPFNFLGQMRAGNAPFPDSSAIVAKIDRSGRFVTTHEELNAKQLPFVSRRNVTQVDSESTMIDSQESSR